MRLRVRFLLKRGYVPGDPVLDADRLVESFFDGLMLSSEEALKVNSMSGPSRPVYSTSYLTETLVVWFHIQASIKH